jgi:hypothetical protein
VNQGLLENLDPEGQRVSASKEKKEMMGHQGLQVHRGVQVLQVQWVLWERRDFLDSQLRGHQVKTVYQGVMVLKE